MRSRDLDWDDCFNVRDLGGQPTEDGHETRFGAFVRADAVERLTDSGWNALVEYGVRTIVDLRFEVERGAGPPPGLPVATLHHPLLPDLSHPDWDEVNALSLGSEPLESTRLVYLEFLERYRDRFGEAVTAIAAPQGDGAVLFHCMAGKDRTGLIAALLLRIVGVEREAIAADYAQSGENLKSMHDAWVEEAADDDERALRIRISLTPAEAMLGVLGALDERYGSSEDYLRAAGVGDGALAYVRTRLLG